MRNPEERKLILLEEIYCRSGNLVAALNLPAQAASALNMSGGPAILVMLAR